MRRLARKPTQTKMFVLFCMEAELQAFIQSSKLTYEHYLISTLHCNAKKLFSHIKVLAPRGHLLALSFMTLLQS